MNPSLFIGSSAKSLFIAKEIEVLLKDTFRVTVWDSIIKPNEYFLEALYRELFFTDFGLFIIFPDDKTEKKGSRGYSTRDNVIFELGMHVGALGIKRGFFLVVDVLKNGKELKLEIPTDLDGIKKTRLRIEVSEENTLLENAANRKALERVSQVITAHIMDSHDGITPSLLPSTSLAIGYFKNFILQACTQLSQTTDFELNGEVYDMTQDIFDFHIIIPDRGDRWSHEAYRKFVRKHNLQQIEVKSVKSPRTFPFFISSQMTNGRLQLYDLPTTLRASSETIKIALPRSTSKADIERVEMKEILNFKRTLEYLLQEPESMEFRDNIHIVSASKILSKDGN